MLIGNKCSPCSDFHSACTECSDKKCKGCKSGYFLKSDSCSLCSRKCAECSEISGVIKCSKCRAYYTLKLNSCERCPENCRQCRLSDSSLVCELCNDKFAKNENNLCSKCPGNCKACTWSTAHSRMECNRNDTSHSCVENENGKSWARKNDGTCVGV